MIPRCSLSISVSSSVSRSVKWEISSLKRWILALWVGGWWGAGGAWVGWHEAAQRRMAIAPRRLCAHAKESHTQPQRVTLGATSHCSLPEATTQPLPRLLLLPPRTRRT